MTNYKYYKTNYQVYEDGRIYSLRRQRFLKPSLSKPTGYYRVHINGKLTYVHRVVAEVWCSGRSKTNNQVSHLDNNKQNNHSNNLEWTTSQQNMKKYWEERRRGLYDNYQPTNEMKAYYKSRYKKRVILRSGVERIKQWK